MKHESKLQDADSSMPGYAMAGGWKIPGRHWRAAVVLNPYQDLLYCMSWDQKEYAANARRRLQDLRFTHFQRQLIK